MVFVADLFVIRLALPYVKRKHERAGRVKKGVPNCVQVCSSVLWPFYSGGNVVKIVGENASLH